MENPPNAEIFIDSFSRFIKNRDQDDRAIDNFKSICEIYKSFLDGNYAKKFCIGEHCKTVYMIELKFGVDEWGASPRQFETREEAETEAESIRQKYPFIGECKIITRKLDDEKT